MQTLKLRGCLDLQQLPPVATLTALQTLSLYHCPQVQQLPPLASLIALQTLNLSICEQLQQLPPLATLTALRALELDGCSQLQQLPPLATLTALHTLTLQDCLRLQQLPSLATLTALQTLDLRGCGRLRTDSLQLPSRRVCIFRPSEDCSTRALQVFRNERVAVPTELGENSGGIGGRPLPVEPVADSPSNRPSNGFWLKGAINKLKCANCFRLACCCFPLKARPDVFNP
jgi:hypothetical protein